MKKRALLQLFTRLEIKISLCVSVDNVCTRAHTLPETIYYGGKLDE